MWSLSVLPVIALLSSTFTLLSKAALSPDGSCGVVGTQTYTCWGNFGNCCSGSGWCGNSTLHCGGGCDSRYGTCSQTKLTPDGSCGGAKGYICHDQFGKCCSDHGFCGDTPASYCGVGCQQSFSVAGGCITGVKPTVSGDCGPASGLTCAGSLGWNGQCCSALGYCGTDINHCGAGCQPGYGSRCN